MTDRELLELAAKACGINAKVNRRAEGTSALDAGLAGRKG